MRVPAARLVLAAAAAAGAVALVSWTPASAWSPSLRERAALEATRMMPASLRLLLDRHRDALLAGLHEEAGREADPAHNLLPRQRGASAAASLREAALAAIKGIDGHANFSVVAQRFGRVAHYVADLNNPARVSDADPKEASWEKDYAAYVESNLGEYPLVFHGWEQAGLDAAGMTPGERLMAFAQAASLRARGYYPPLKAAYDPASKVPLRVRFDVRSLPYGIGSLSWSHTVTDTARVWLFIWRQAHGDLYGTPWLAAAPKAVPSAAGAGGADP